MPSYRISPRDLGRFAAALAISLLVSTVFGLPSGFAADLSQTHVLQFDAARLAWQESEEGSRLRIEDGNTLQVPGRPELPMDVRQWVIPRGMRVTAVRIEETRWVDLESRSLVQARPMVSSDGEVAAIPGWAQGEEWQEGAVYPPVPARLTGTRKLAGWSIASVEVFPVRQLQDGRLQRLASARITLDLDFDEKAGETAERRVAWPGVHETDAAVVVSIVDNPADVSRHGPPRGLDPSVAQVDMSVLQGGLAKTPRLYDGPVDFLIVTNAAFAGEMQRLADYRTAEGLNSAVVVLDDILANYRNGADRQETLRLFLRKAYEDWGLQYVLLAGDAEIIPPRYARSLFYPVTGFTDIPSDLYYSCLDGNWNVDADGIYAEAYQDFLNTGDEADMLAELSLGRAPIKDVGQAAGFVDRILAYSSPADTNYAGQALFMSEVLFPQNWDGSEPISLDGAQYSENIVFDSILGGGNLMQSWRMYENDTAYLGAIPETKSAALDSMSSGNFGLVAHVGHGFYYNMSVGDGNIFVADVETLTNAPNYFFLYALNCSSGAFDFDCLLEKFLQIDGGGAAATVGSSRAAFPTTADTYQQAFFNEVFVNSTTRVGDAQRISRANYVGSTNVEGSHRWTHLTYHLFTDPTLRLWKESPSPSAVTHASVLELGSQVLNVTVDSGGPVTGATVAASRPDGTLVVGLTDGSGSVDLDVAPLTSSEGAITLHVSGRNLMPYEDTVDVQAGAGAHVRGIPVAVVDDGTGFSSGDGDGDVDSGEIVEWSFQFENDGDGTSASSTSATLVPVDAAGATLVDDTINVGTVNTPAPVVPAENFVVEIANTVPDGTRLVFDLLISSNGDTWTQRVELVALAPELEVSRITWDDSAGDGDGIIDQGEPISLSVEVVNYGGGTVNSLNGSLTSGAAAVNVLLGSSSWPALGTKDMAAGNNAFQFVESDVLVENWFTLTLSDEEGRQWTHDFELRPPATPPAPSLDTSVGPTSIAVLMDSTTEPHFYGYRIFRSTNEAGPFSEITEDRVAQAGRILDENLASLTRYYYRVALVDSSSVASPMSPVASASTSPPELAGGFPFPLGREVAGAIAVGDVRGDGSKVAVFGSEYIYAIDSDGNELRDGDQDSQTLGPFAGDDSAPRFTPSGITMADLDGDGSEEIIAGNWDSLELWVVQADGSPFPGWPRQMNNKNWGTPSVGDLDNDGDLEIVVNTVGRRTYVFHHDGSEFFDGDNDGDGDGVFHVRLGEIFNRSTPLLLDVDDDGTLEILFGTHWRDGSDNFVYALKNDATNAPGWPRNMGAAGYSVTHMTAADLDQDGEEEMTFLCDNDSLYVFEKDGSNMAGYPQPFLTQSANKDSKTPAVAFGDFDKNGDLEMVVVSIIDHDECEVYIKDHDGTTWPGWPRTLPGLSESSPLVADINGDLALDVVFGIGGGSDNKPNVLYAFESDGSDVAGFPITLPGAVRAVPVITDFDEDGDVDVVYAGFDLFLHVWDMPFTYYPHLAPWPTFQGNMRRTGVYREDQVTGTLTANVAVVATPRGVQLESIFVGGSTSGLELNVERRDVEDGYQWTRVGEAVTVVDGSLVFRDDGVEVGRTYEYRLVDDSGSLAFYSESIFVPALRAALHGATPNPFNPSTTLRFEVPGTAGAQVPTRLEIYDLSGRHVRTLHSGPLAPGAHSLVWQGQDDQGRSVASGVYFARLSCAGEQKAIKMTLVK